MFTQEAAPATQGWLQTIKDKLRLEEIAQKLNISLDTIGETALWFGIGFLGGFLLKRYGRYVLLALLACLVMLWGLSYFELISIHFDNFKEVVGFATTDTVASLFATFGTWAKAHVIQSIACMVGFFFGCKIG